MSDKLFISQKQLRRYAELKRAEDSCELDRLAERRDLIALLHGGAVIESGPLSAKLKRFEQRSLYRANVIEAIGQTEYERIRSLVRPTLLEQLWIVPGKEWDSGTFFPEGDPLVDPLRRV